MYKQKKVLSQKWVLKATQQDETAQEEPRVHVRRWANSSRVGEGGYPEVQPATLTEQQLAQPGAHATPQGSIEPAACRAEPAPIAQLGLLKDAALFQEQHVKPPLPWNTAAAGTLRGVSPKRSAEGSWMESIVHQLRLKGNAVQTSMGQTPGALQPTLTNKRVRQQARAFQHAAANMCGMDAAASCEGPPGLAPEPYVRPPGLFYDGLSAEALEFADPSLDAYHASAYDFCQDLTQWDIDLLAAYEDPYLSGMHYDESFDANLAMPYYSDGQEMLPMQVPLPHYSSMFQEAESCDWYVDTDTAKESDDNTPAVARLLSSTATTAAADSDESPASSNSSSADIHETGAATKPRATPVSWQQPEFAVGKDGAALREMARVLEIKEQKMKDIVDQIFALGWNSITWRNGYTALHLAAEMGEDAVMPLLTLLGADPTHADYKGRRAIDVARKKQHWKCVETLKKLGNAQREAVISETADVTAKLITHEKDIKHAR